MSQNDQIWKIRIPEFTKSAEADDYPALIKMIEAINTQYNIRKNIVQMRVELSHTDNPAYWFDLSDSVLNTLLIQYQSLKVQITKSTLESVLNSWYVKNYDPIKAYFESLPPWDGTDYLQQLTDTIQTENQEAWKIYFEKWMVAMVRCSIEKSVTNQQMLVFYGKQGAGKTRWINKLLPEALKPYFFSGHANLEDQVFQLKLGTNMLLFFDELDAYTGNKQAIIKAAITQENIKIRLLFDTYDTVVQRRASFVAAINHETFLNDMSGSRRFLVNECLSINHEHDLNMDLVYSQVYHKAKDLDFRHYFIGDEIKQIESHNERFKTKTDAEILIERYFKPADENTIESFILTATEVVDFIKERIGSRMFSNPQKVGEALNKMGFKRTSRDTGKEKRYGYLMMHC